MNDLLKSEKFKYKHKFDDRLRESTMVKEKYKDRLPVIVEKDPKAHSSIPSIDKQKFLVPKDLTIGQFIYVIRKRIKLKPEISIYIYCDNMLPTTSSFIKDIYQQNMDSDGFLYLNYSGENFFGGQEKVLFLLKK